MNGDFFRYLFFLLVLPATLQAQTDSTQLKPDTSNQVQSLPQRYLYDKDLLPASFHLKRRQALRDSMPENSVAVLFANPVRNRSNDVDYEYHQNPDFYYLTGLIEPHSMLLVFKENQYFDTILTNEIAFVQPRDPRFEIWNGRRLGTRGVKEVLGIKTALLNREFSLFSIDFAKFDQVLYLTPQEDVRDDSRDKGDLFSLIKHFKRKADTMLTTDGQSKLREILSALRQQKEPEELNLLIQAIDITCNAQKELMKALDSTMTEYQAEALVEFIFKKNGAEHPGFPSILGGGENSCILHYISNRKHLEGMDMLVADIGAEYHGYSADITRTMPVDGKFSEEEAAIYNIVLKAQEAGIAASKAGNRFWDPHSAAKEVIREGLLELGIIDSKFAVDKYFMHGTSHYLGLDVHDAGLYGPLRPGQIITVEPGVYIAEGSDCDPKWWNIGVRIEDDVLITEAEPEVLSSCVPKTIEEIESVMKIDPLIKMR